MAIRLPALILMTLRLSVEGRLAAPSNQTMPAGFQCASFECALVCFPRFHTAYGMVEWQLVLARCRYKACYALWVCAGLRGRTWYVRCAIN